MSAPAGRDASAGGGVAGRDASAGAGAGAGTGGGTGRGWSGGASVTTLVLVRHGATSHTAEKRFSGGLGGSDPGLVEEGRAQVRATADWFARQASDGAGAADGGVDVLVSSPVRRARESAEILAARLGREVLVEEGLAEMEFGSWEGLTFAQVREQDPDAMTAWLGSLDVPAGGGESFRSVRERVLAGLGRLLAEHAGRTVLAVSHVTPIKVLVAHALGAPLHAVFRMELAPASVTVLAFYADGNASLRRFNARPGDRPL